MIINKFYKYLIKMKWTLRSLCLALIISNIAFVTYAETSAQYPAYLWSSMIKGKKVEIKPLAGSESEYKSTNSTKVSDEIKNILDTTDANSFIVYQRPGMTTQDFVSTLVNSYKIGNILRDTKKGALERSYTDVTGTPVGDLVSKRFEGVKTHTIDSKESLDNLKKEIATAEKPFIHKYYVVELPFAKDSVFDDVVYQVERAFEDRTLGNHVSVIAGSESSRRNLDETDVEPTNDAANVKADAENIFLTSHILTMILISIPLILLVIMAVLQLFYIKAPTLFVEKSIDFGRIEK